MGTGHLPEVKVLERTNRLPTFFIFQMKTNGLALNNKVTIKLGQIEANMKLKARKEYNY